MKRNKVLTGDQRRERLEIISYDVSARDRNASIIPKLGAFECVYLVMISILDIQADLTRSWKCPAETTR